MCCFHCNIRLAQIEISVEQVSQRTGKAPEPVWQKCWYGNKYNLLYKQNLTECTNGKTKAESIYTVYQ